MRLLMISLGTLFLCGLAFLGIRFWGLSTPYQKFDHVFWKNPPPYYAVRLRTLMEAERLAREPRDLIYWLDVHETLDHQFLVVLQDTINSVLNEENLGKANWKGPQIPRYNLSQLRPLLPDSPLLVDILKEFPKKRVIINIVDNVPDIQFELVKLLEGLTPDNRLLVQSETDVILRSIKDLKPLWLYGSSNADLMRLLSFESVSLIVASPFLGDVYISPLQLLKRDVLKNSVIDEVHRRKKNVFLGPLSTIKEYETAHKTDADGFIFGSMEFFLHTQEQNAL